MSASPTMTYESTACMQLEVLDPSDQFKAIDAYVREFDRRMAEWPTLAKMVLDVKKRELWKYGGFANYTAWVENAAPTCARKVFESVALYGSLKDDFTDEDLQGVSKDTAYKARQLSPKARQNPKVKAALKKPRSEFVATVKAEEPDQHITDDVSKRFNFNEQEWDDIQFVLHAYREQEGDEGLSDEKIIFEIFHEWKERKGL